MIQERSLWSIIVPITLMLTSMAVADANNLIANGDFELETLNGYHYLQFIIDNEDNGPSLPGSYCASTDYVGADIRTFRSCGSTTTGRIKGGKTYVASWDYKTTSEITDPCLVVAQAHLRFYANVMDVNTTVDPCAAGATAIGALDVNLFPTDGNWVAQTVNMAAPAGARALDIAFDKFAGQSLMEHLISFDNIVVYEQDPEPEPPLYLDANDSIIINSGFEEVALEPNVWPGWYLGDPNYYDDGNNHTLGNYVTILDDSNVADVNKYGLPYDGNRCAVLTRVPTVYLWDRIDIRSLYHPIDVNDNYAATFSYKTLPGYTGSARAFFRYWIYDGTGFIQEFVWALPPTDGEWVTLKSCCIRPPASARSIDIRIGMWQYMSDTTGWCNGVGTLLIDNVNVIKTSTKGDLNCDCGIDFYDLAMLAQRWLTVFEN